MHAALDYQTLSNLEGRFQKETMKMETIFATFVSKLCKSLKEREVSIQDLVTNLLMIKAFSKQLESDDKPELLFLAKEQLTAAKTIDNVFNTLSSYVSFFNYEIIEHIVHLHGEESDRKKFEEYLSAFEEFCRRRAHEKIPLFVDCIPDEAKFTPLKMKVESDLLKLYTLKAINQFRAKLCSILGVTESGLRLLSIEEGCILLTFILPKFVVSHVFPLSNYQKKILVSDGVVKYSLNSEEFVSIGDPKPIYKRKELTVTSLSEQFGQRRPPLSVTIRGILERYPDGQIFKVPCQQHYDHYAITLYYL